LKLQSKIVFPFSLLFVAATLITALVSISVMSRSLEYRVDAQLEQSSKLVARAGFALNPSILASLKTVIRADIVTYAQDGTVLATTLTPPTRDKVIPVVLSRDAPTAALHTPDDFVIRRAQIDGVAYKIAYRPLLSTPNAVIALVEDDSDVANTRKTIAEVVLLIAALVVVVLSLIGHRIAKGVTGPVLRLVDFTKRVAAGERREKAGITSHDEIGTLASAFNDMVVQLHTSEEKALRSEKLALTGLLAARVAHEVRNPLSAMKIQAQLLRSKLSSQGDQSQTELVGSILQAIDRVEWVVRGMLDLASPRELNLKREDIRDVLDEVLVLTGPQLSHRKITVTKRFEDEIPMVSLDRDRFKLSLLNLIMNASEAMTNGGHLELAVTGNSSKTSVIVEIGDDGAGIDASIEDKLFDPFVTTKREGVGLGLVNTKNIIEAHHGTVQLLRRESGGTRAVIELPTKE
jgi:signal transduction histidine kinase